MIENPNIQDIDHACRIIKNVAIEYRLSPKDVVDFFFVGANSAVQLCPERAGTFAVETKA